MTDDPGPRPAPVLPPGKAPRRPDAARARPAVPLRETILAEVRRAIASGAMPPGSRVTERALSETHGVSRTVAREVIRQIEAERLGEMVPHRGLRIARLTPQLVGDIYEIRLALELQIVLRFCEVATPAHLARLRRIFARLVLLETSARHEEIARRTAALVDYMVEVTGKRTAGEILAHLVTRITMLRILSLRNPGQTARGIAILERVVGALERRDRAAVEALLREHTEVACASAIAQLRQMPAGEDG